MNLYNPFIASLNHLRNGNLSPFQEAGSLLLEHRECSVFKVHHKLYQFAKDGVIFSEREGISSAESVIDEFLDTNDEESHAFWEREKWEQGIAKLKEVSA